MNPQELSIETMLHRLRTIVWEKIVATSCKLFSELVKALKELDHHNNQLEKQIDEDTMVQEGHEKDI